MKLLNILLLGFLAMVLAWAAWILSKPKVYRQSTPQQEEVLNGLLPPDVQHGNSVTTYTSMEEMFEHMTSDMNSANHHVHMLFFKFEDDATGRRLGTTMAALAANRVQVRLLYDDFMCRQWKPLYRRLRKQGVDARGYNPVHLPILIKRDYYRTHRKLALIDGRVAYIGGVNIADRYLYGLPWGRWRDTMVRIEGPAVAALQRSFVADWHFATGQLLASPAYFPRVAAAGTLPVRIITSGPIGDGPAIMHYTVGLLDRAERYAWFESPYFIPTPELRQAFLAAARRGVDVRVLLPPRGDRGEGTQLASKSYFAEAMAAGIKIGLYQSGYLHSKIIVCDDTTAVVGSCNLDPRSQLLCQEVAAVIDDNGYAAELKQVFLADEAESSYIDPAEWATRSCWQKTQESIMRLVASQL